MKTLPLALLALLSIPSAWAQSNAAALDLSLPPSAAYAKDPPGTWYGDTQPARPKKAAALAAPVDPCVLYGDDDGDGVSGSVTTGIGYSKGRGRSTYNAVNLNLCKTTYDDNGKPRTFNFNINVDRYEGPGGYYGPYGGYPGRPMMRGAPHP
ncbi:hypothetical protein J2X02_002365 [Pseudoxanthomonas japonensis]|jgi:hypothetical protein|uniref:hypothetical protein n=1 Tax=Pseudoxanthomonas TaxID=83618 RepID=UPI000783FDFB|nr:MULTISPECIES: hypothetical protein [Pseudoxanthomonas]MBL8256204.1 hypothetical protein [Pseudoxanthomonas mexicana]MDR7069514.1 hypothetical protein [Pseudoxanthomonas japonensis]